MVTVQNRVKYKLILFLCFIVIGFCGLIVKNFIQPAAAQSASDWTLITDGFESGDFLSPTNSNNWLRSTSGCTGTCIQVANTNPHTGTYSLEAIGQGSNIALIYKLNIAGGDISNGKLEFWINADAPTVATTVGVAQMSDSGNNSLALLRIDATKKIYIHGDATENRYQLSGWTKVAFAYQAGASGSVKLWVNDNLVRTFPTSTTANIAYIKIGKVSIGSVTDGSIFFDDVTFTMPAIADLWVDKAAGSDSNNGLTEGTAFATIQKAANIAGPGTTVHIKSGEYNEQVKPQYKGLNPENLTITFQGEAGHDVYIDGDANNDGTRELPVSLWNGLFSIDNVDHVKLSNFTIRQSNWMGLYAVGTDNLEVSNITTLNTNASGLYVNGAGNVTVNNNTVRAGCEYGNDPLSLPQENISIVHVHDFEVAYNHVYDGVGLEQGGEGIDVKGNSYHGNIHHNHVYDLPDDVGIYVGVTTSGSLDHPELGAYELNVYNNEVNTDTGIAVSAEGISVTEKGGNVQDVKIFNNLVYGGNNGGILVTRWNGKGITGTKSNIDIFNNVVYKNSQVSITGIGVQCYASGEVSNVNIWNNIVSQNGQSQIDVHSCAANVVVENNLIDGYIGDSIYEVDPSDPVACPNCLASSPNFVDPDNATPDFHLQAGAGGIDAGKAVYVDLDFDGNYELLDFDYADNPRPVNSLFDLGAYEYQTQSYTVNFTAGANGTLTGTTSQSVNSGSNASAVTAVANTGYHFVNWTGTGFTTSTSNPLTVTNVTQNLNLTANFAINTYTITATSSGDGTITPSGIITYNYAESQNFVFTPTLGQSIRAVYVDGNSIPVVSDYTFNSLTTNHTIAVTFSTQTLSAGFTSNLTNINAGENIQFTDTSAIPTGKSIVSWLWEFGDGATSTASSPSHTYANSGTYTVKLTITDNLGNTSVKQITNYVKVNTITNSTPTPTTSPVPTATPTPTISPTQAPSPTPTTVPTPPGRGGKKKTASMSDLTGSVMGTMEDVKTQAQQTFNQFGVLSWVWLSAVLILSMWSITIIISRPIDKTHHGSYSFQ